ncbi:2-dehydro-3-deoxyphosphooctonate aldolase [Flavobacterium sp. SUN046]|uniref:2-dehydro-3-deoxyphosphooctonate aldolase n=1 Tax=Flavobacterium sp. SUN046 TaxID=3002440 RepID=UPI002DBD6215|nr:2-dehydro-3-deoxyphosphooctonate aldolase [Flavobacterium sp. SUN046]MEC4051057.1 2-dehydro-3-deoxyphosphooctonate aldolase [Flavobacterium sp. SUN046]
MRSIQLLFLFTTLSFFTSCVSTKSTLKNVDNSQIKPILSSNHFIITEMATDMKYGYDKDYPINIGFDNEKYGSNNIVYFFNALRGASGEYFTFKKIDNCCPFPSTRSKMGAGTLEIYEITFEKSKNTVQLYFNIFDKGKIMCPKGFSIKSF